MKKTKTYNNVSEMVHDLSENEAFAREMDAIIESQQLITALVAQRTARGISQTQIADKMGCSQSRISKIESSNDVDLSLGDLIAYSAAIDLEPHIALRNRGVTLVELVKFHAFSMKRALDRLASLSKDDELMARAGLHFCGEAVLNVIRFIGEAATKLMPTVKSESPFVVEVATESEVAKCETCRAAS